MQYAIVVHRRGHDSEVAELVDKPKAEARKAARRMAEHAFPDCTVTGSVKTSDAFVAKRDGEYAGTVSVEIAEER